MSIEQTLEAIRNAVAEVKEGQTRLEGMLAPVKRDVDELRGDVYGISSVPGSGLKPQVGAIKAVCDQKCPQGFWGFMTPVTQTVLAWAIITALAAFIILVFLHPVLWPVIKGDVP